jgi:putative ABC transport system permease protein
VIRHLVRLSWNRKRANALIMIEILVCFLVLTAVTTGAAYYLTNWRRPLGFSSENVWQVEIEYSRFDGASEAERQAIIARLQQVHREVAALPEVESAALATNTPYSQSTSSTTMVLEGREEDVNMGAATVELDDVLGLTIERGRWLEAGDETRAWIPVVINRKLAQARFGDGDPLGQPLDPNPEPEAGEAEARVVGVITDLRRNGEFAASPHLAIAPARFTDLEEYPPDRMLLKLRPGTGVVFEEQLISVLNRIAPEWTFNVDSLASSRESMLRIYLLPLLVLGLIASFLVIMVGLGLMGVLWQSVTRRTGEIGLRRALGGTAGAVRSQIMGELLVITTIAVGLGTLVCLQLPILDVLPFLGLPIYIAGLALSLAIIYGVVALCSLYPSWLATRIHPGPALQHE